MLRKEVWDDDASLDTIYQAVKSLRKLLKTAGIQVEIEGRNGNYILHCPCEPPDVLLISAHPPFLSFSTKPFSGRHRHTSLDGQRQHCPGQERR